MALKIRKDVLNLPADDDTVLWYGRAVAAMKARPINDPLSWRYQAAIHEYIAAADPLKTPGDVLPSVTERRAFWTQCQHGSYYFLPWHRMYLHFFEGIVAAEVARQQGPKDWALPYWNYSQNVASRLLPPGFRSKTLPGGATNPLYVAERDPKANKGQAFADATDVDLSGCLIESTFRGIAAAGASSFGGPVTKFEHGGGTAGALEITPHGSIHGAVGGTHGWMGAFNTAALDPIFWLHHANIDRLWEVWLKRAPGDTNPTTNAWLKSVSFRFHDANGKIVKMIPSRVVDTTAAPLSYVYDDTKDPLPPALVPGPAGATIIGGKAMAKQRPAALVGATARGFSLGDDATHVALQLRPKAAKGPSPLSAARGPRKVYLNIENLTSSKRAPAYDVYLNVPEGSNPKTFERLHAGRLPMFGLSEASRRDKTHAGSGLHYVLNVTQLYQVLSREPGWNPEKLRVSIVPTRKAEETKVRVGRVSLYSE